MGRDRERMQRQYGRHKKGPPYVRLPTAMLQGQAWQELSPFAKLIYIKIKANYKGYNNGEIDFTYKEAKKGFLPKKNEFSAPTVSKALKELINKEWLERTQHGGLYRYYCKYRLTGKYDTML